MVWKPRLEIKKVKIKKSKGKNIGPTYVIFYFIYLIISFEILVTSSDYYKKLI